DRLPGSLVAPATDCGLGHLGMVDEGALDLDRRDSMPGDVHDIVDAAKQPEVAVLVHAGAVTREVHVVEPPPARLSVALVVLMDPAQHRRPGTLQHEIASRARSDLITPVVDDCRRDAGE